MNLPQEIHHNIGVFVSIILRLKLASWYRWTALDYKEAKYRFIERHIDYTKLKARIKR